MNSNNNLYEEFKKELVKKIISIKNKINECNSHIELIKKEYINIKLGKFGEFLSKELINSASNLKMLQCGVQKINDKKKMSIYYLRMK
jgi:hypothetical protein